MSSAAKIDDSTVLKGMCQKYIYKQRYVKIILKGLFYSTVNQIYLIQFNILIYFFPLITVFITVMPIFLKAKNHDLFIQTLVFSLITSGTPLFCWNLMVICQKMFTFSWATKFLPDRGTMNF